MVTPFFFWYKRKFTIFALSCHYLPQLINAPMIDNIREIVDPGKINIVVANHSEFDHSGALPAVMKHCPNATVVVSKRGLESVEGHFHQMWSFKAVNTGDKENIGQQDLIINEAPK